MFYLMTYSTHFILRLYGIGHMVKDPLKSQDVNLAISSVYFVSLLQQESIKSQDRNLPYISSVYSVVFSYSVQVRDPDPHST